MQITQYNNFHFITEAYIYDITAQRYVEDRYITFDKCYLYNDYQISGNLSLLNKDLSIENMTTTAIQEVAGQMLLARKERVWSFNGFRDMSVNRNTTPRPAMFSSSWSDPSYSAQYYIDKVINPSAISTTKEWLEQQRFRDKYLAVRLFFSNLAEQGKHKLVTNFLYGNDMYSVR